nr:antibiotic biosynthesis monooxygenase [Rhodococcus sp. (in: high G+C Gram-positive bacteria)]
MITAPATAVSIFHREDAGETFASWAAELHAAAENAPGFDSALISAPDANSFEWAAAVSFDTEEHLHAWLDSAERTALLRSGDRLGHHRISTDVIVVEGSAPSTGVGIITHDVANGRQDEFLASQQELVELSSSFSGFEGAVLLGPGRPTDEVLGDTASKWMSVLRFRTDRQLSAWMQSDVRSAALPELRKQLTGDFSVITHSTPFGSIVRVEDGKTQVTPDWKTAMLVLLVLYPTVMTLSRFVGPLLDDIGSPPWLSMWLSQILSVGLMTYFFMPAVTGWFRRWLDPIDGAPRTVSLIGALAVVVVYAVTLTLFASIKWLQFWDYFD